MIAEGHGRRNVVEWGAEINHAELQSKGVK